MTDEGFVGRVYKMSALVCAFVLLALMAYKVAPGIVVGVLIGYSVGVLSLATLEIVINRTFRPGNRVAKAKYAVIVVLKYAAIGAILYTIVRTNHVSLPGFAAGFGIIQAVIVLKTLGALLVQARSQNRRPIGGE